MYRGFIILSELSNELVSIEIFPHDSCHPAITQNTVHKELERLQQVLDLLYSVVLL